MGRFLEEVFRFFLLAVGGLALDLFLFYVGIASGLSVFHSNFLSSSLALLVAYQFAVKKVFKANGGWFRLAVFFAWYALSIATFSFVADWLHTSMSWSEIQSKLAIVGPSFFTNFFVVRKILRFQKVGNLLNQKHRLIP